jgi:hypothetical protein
MPNQTLLDALKVEPEELAAFSRFCECCEDFDAGGYDVPKDMMKRLAMIGLVRSCGFSRYETTSLGNLIREDAHPSTPERDSVIEECAKDAIREAIGASLGDAMDCTRTWSAWGVGAMSQGDFQLVADNDERVEEIVDAVCAALKGKAAVGRDAERRDLITAIDGLLKFCEGCLSGPDLSHPAIIGASNIVFRAKRDAAIQSAKGEGNV